MIVQSVKIFVIYFYAPFCTVDIRCRFFFMTARRNLSSESSCERTIKTDSEIISFHVILYISFTVFY